MINHVRTLVLSVLVALFALPAWAQSSGAAAGQDWELIENPATQTLAVTASFDNGLTILSRCMGGVLDVIVTGLPEAPRRITSRNLLLWIGDEAPKSGTAWTVGANRSVAFSRIPAMTARELAKGGTLQIVVPAEAGRPRTRYVMELTPSDNAIERTLTACGRALADPRDNEKEGTGADGLPGGVIWVRAPQPEFPDSVHGRSPIDGYVTLSCQVQTGGDLDKCEIESEQPAGFNLGRSVLRSLRRARVGQTDEARAAGTPFEGVLILFTVNFRLEEL